MPRITFHHDGRGKFPWVPIDGSPNLIHVSCYNDQHGAILRNYIRFINAIYPVVAVSFNLLMTTRYYIWILSSPIELISPGSSFDTRVRETKPVSGTATTFHIYVVVTKFAIPDSRAHHSIYQIRLRTFYGWWIINVQPTPARSRRRGRQDDLRHLPICSCVGGAAATLRLWLIIVSIVPQLTGWNTLGKRAWIEYFIPYHCEWSCH